MTADVLHSSSPRTPGSRPLQNLSSRVLAPRFPVSADARKSAHVTRLT
ncbi:hypothetical protein E2C01_102353 [Portunus trituberculatus]|uniref:Uncharacterized protein n=1 Tax=Portunus trituberculatus TaxID=210409 RepID=A0A5B7KMD9_PORTR|nr:hypothetical protein [Portunus trituberculatus]